MANNRTGRNIALDAAGGVVKIILSVEPVRFPLTGIGRYTWELAQELACSSEISELKYFAGRHFLPALPVASTQANRQHSIKQWVQRSYLAVEAYRLLMPPLKRRALNGYEDFLYHGPNFFLPPFAGKRIATFHDLSPFTWTQCNTPQRIRYTQKELLKTLKWADALITDSEYTRQELANYFSWPRDKIYAVPLAYSADFKPRDITECNSVLAKYDLSYKKFSLYVGTIEPRKNLINLLDAYSRLSLLLRREFPLILSGYQGWNNEDIIRKIAIGQREGWVKYLGFLPTAELPLLFSAAKLFCFPSLYEGFGLPVLEAMASGTPVFCSNASSLPEVVGNAAAMCSPDDVDQMTNLISECLLNTEWQLQAANAGIVQAGQFSWQKTAELTIDAYRNVLAND